MPGFGFERFEESDKHIVKKEPLKRKWIYILLFINFLLLLVNGLAFIKYAVVVRFKSDIFGIDNSLPKCSVESDAEKFDCFPDINVNEESCLNRGCCWQQIANSDINVPYCYFPQDYASYSYKNITHTSSGVVGYLEQKIKSNYPKDVNLLRLEAHFETSYRLRIKVTDAAQERYESPYPKLRLTNSSSKNPLYNVQFDEKTSGFLVSRTNGQVLFDSINKGGFTYADQFLQISALFYGKIYGLGEHQTSLQLDTNWTRFTLFNQDSIPVDNMNLYGSHPFYLILEPNGTSHGVYLHNSNAMDVLLQPLPAITFRTIGGILDFYFFVGPTPADVVRQYTELIGRPFFPPYWSLGFHLCRFGYKNVSHMEAVLNRTISAGIPMDTQWVDIDYMVEKNDFTLNNNTFSELPKFINQLQSSKNMHFIPILDPGVSAGETKGTYQPYDEGIQLGIFIKNEDGSPFVGKVWNKNSTVFPDFTNRKTFVYWTGLIHKLHDQIPFDGLWIDMNEPSNFLDGTVDGCPNNTLENPPYLPAVGGGKLAHKTVCMSAKQSIGNHYDLHNVYGISEAHATNRALKEILQERAFVISRSTFPGIGHYAGHWSGDVTSTWDDMKHSIPQMLLFSLYGVPMMGADICGFNGNTTKYLCLRWSQLGAFYPFSRNHNTDDGVDQDPAAFDDEVVNSTKAALNIRYTLLPYLYTLFWKAHTLGDTVARPLFFEFPNDPNTHSLDESFLWGCCLLIVPVLKEFDTTVSTYLPPGRWYDWYSYEGVESNGANMTLHAGTDTIPLLVRGGAILPLQSPASTTVISRKNKMMILAAYDTNLTADGSLYWDDGDGLQTMEHHAYGFVKFSLNVTALSTSIKHWNISDAPVIGEINILGFVKHVNTVFINGTTKEFSWNSTNLVLSLLNLNIPVNVPFSVTWSN